MTEDVSRRKMLSLLGFGAALGFAVSAVLEPLEAEAQDTTTGRSEPHCARHRHRARHRNTREEPADIATHHSSSATGRAPRSPCCTSGSSRAIAIAAQRSGARGQHQTKRTREAHAFLVRVCVRETKVSMSASRVPTIR